MFWKGSQFNDLYPDSAHIDSFKNVKKNKISKKGKKCLHADQVREIAQN